MRPYLGVLLIAGSVAVAAWFWSAELGSGPQCSNSRTSGLECRYLADVPARSEWQRPVALFVGVAGAGFGLLAVRTRTPLRTTSRG